jgi:hypothetical protein|uniref:hypothetical protein n=1 Tax=Candidatus Nanopelagicus sp. TaxID=2518620 RepID=UPI004049AFD1
MKNLKLKKGLTALISAALVAAFTVAVPSAARAAEPTCTTVSNVETCKGVDDNGSKYEIRMPAKFNGMLFLYSHGIRNQVLLPLIPVVNPTGTYSTPRSEPEVAPGRTTADQEIIAQALLKQGYAVAGAGVQVNGWSVPEAVEANLLLVIKAKDMFPKITKVVSWGDSLGGHISQSLSEQYGIIDAAADLHLAGSAAKQYSYANDVLWMYKTLFDPTIKGNGYTQPVSATDTRGYMELIGDIGKLLTVLNALGTAIKTNPTAPVWPVTATNVPATLKAIPVRSAILLIGLLAGMPTQSTTYDSASGPAGPLETTFGLAISPALAILENTSTALALGVIGNYDAEMRCGGSIFDNTATDYSANLGDNGDIYAAALSGKTATAGMLAFLNRLNPAAPRVAASASAVACINNQAAYTGKITVPTITVSQTADQITPAGYVQKLKNQYAAAVNNGDAKPGLLLNIWNKPPDAYTVFDATGAAVTPTAPTTGTSHYMYTNAQILVIAKLLASAGKSGKLPSVARAKSALKNDSSMFIDPAYTPALMPQDK